MKHKIVLVPFPFDDLSATKARPAVCLTNEIKPYGHIVLAFITSLVSNPETTDLVINSTDEAFSKSGLKVSSTVRLHRLVTVSRSLIKRQLGILSPEQISRIQLRLKELFDL